MVEDISIAVTNYNQHIETVITTINEFKNKLSTENIVILEEQVQNLKLSNERHTPIVIDYINKYQASEAKLKKLNDDKSERREQLDQSMSEMLKSYQGEINELLKNFGAGFSIEQMKSSHQAGMPRMEYGLKLRKKIVRLGNRNDQGLHFGTVLSEGDKRALALAFFLARIKIDHTNIQNQILVFDDPISSFDRNRREQTKNSLVFLADQCRQLIILSHEAYFIRELRKKFAKNYKIAPCIIGIDSINEYDSIFNECNIDEICASPYYQRHRLVNNYVKGTDHQPNARSVAEALRPLMEGYYHRKFPVIIHDEYSFGKIIEQIKDAREVDHPLNHLQGKTSEMDMLNQYASNFHHDTNPNYASISIEAGELKTFSKRVLDLIYKN